MTEAERWARLRELFESASEVRPEERDAFLARECADDDLRREVVSLLAAADGSGPLDALALRLTPLRDLLTERVPERVGPYEVSERIGEGGMAVVYRARDPRLQRDVALKFLPATLHHHTPAAERLMGEARAASALDHPNICTIYDIASADNDRLFIAMAYYGGGTLQDRLRHGPLPVEEALDIARQIADALQCAHDAGIVHRDVKPANVAFGERGEAKVLDFGVAILTDAADPAESAGTPLYMAPEQVRGGGTDPRSDVWALGVVLYEMLTGRQPFTGEDREAVHAAILDNEPVPVSDLRRDVPGGVTALVARALEKDPAERFASAAAFATGLSDARSAIATRRRVFRRNAYRAAAALALIVSVAAAARVGMNQRPGDVASPDNLLDDQFVRGRVRYYAGNPESNEAAIAIFRSIVEHDSTYAPARAFLGAAYAVAVRPDFSRSGDAQWLDSALVHANAAVALAPGLPAAHAALGVVHRWSNRVDDAMAHHRHALSLDPEYAMSMIELGYLSHVAGRPDEAAIWLERGLAIEPAVPAARQYAAALYRAFDMQDEAHRHLIAGRTIAPDDATLIWETVQLALIGGDTVAAREEFEAYIQLTPPGERERMRAWFELIRGDLRAAHSHIERVDLTDAPSYDLRAFGSVYMQVGDRERGAALLRRALESIAATGSIPDWGYSRPQYYKAFVHASLGERELALTALEKWADAGGIRSWSRLAYEPQWESIADEPRFQEVVRRTGETFREKRARVAAELSRRRD